MRGIVLEEMPPSQLVQCVRKADTGERWIELCSVAQLLNELVYRKDETELVRRILTAREVEIIRHLTSRLHDRDIANQLFLSKGTIKVHFHHIYTHLRLKRRMAFIRDALE